MKRRRFDRISFEPQIDLHNWLLIFPKIARATRVINQYFGVSRHGQIAAAIPLNAIGRQLLRSTGSNREEVA